MFSIRLNWIISSDYKSNYFFRSVVIGTDFLTWILIAPILYKQNKEFNSYWNWYKGAIIIYVLENRHRLKMYKQAFTINKNYIVGMEECAHCQSLLNNCTSGANASKFLVFPCYKNYLNILTPSIFRFFSIIGYYKNIKV